MPAQASEKVVITAMLPQHFAQDVLANEYLEIITNKVANKGKRPART